MKTINTLAAFANRIGWMIGCITIMNYAHEHWPVPYLVATAVFLLACAGWYLWKFVVQPFRTGLRGERA